MSFRFRSFAPEDPAVVHARRWRTLGMLCLSLMVVMIGNSSVNIALPSIAKQLHASQAQLQWTADAYMLVFAGALFPAAALGDRYGRKGALQAGLLAFLTGAIIASFAPDPRVLIVARALMGGAAGFVMPSTLSILTSVFTGLERPRAISIWAGVAASGSSFGHVVSGFILDHFRWGAVFLVNVPLILVALIGGLWLVPTSKSDSPLPLDLPGAGLLVVGLVSLVYGLIEGPHLGWTSAGTLATFAVATAAIALFAWREQTAAHPMLPLRLFANPNLSAGTLGIVMAYFGLFSTFYLVAQYLQMVRSFTPFQSGAMMLPLSVTLLVLSPQAPKLVRRFGVNVVVPAGLLLLAAGLFIFSRLGRTTPWGVVPVMAFILAVGITWVSSPLTTLVMSAVPADRAGVGSAMNDATRQIGGAIGVAVLGSATSTGYVRVMRPLVEGLPGADARLALSGAAGANEVATRLGGASGEALAAHARDALGHGLSSATGLGAALMVGAAVVAAVLLARSQRAGTVARPEPEPERPASVRPGS